MRYRSTAAAVVIALAAVACGGGDSEVPATTDEDPVTPYGIVVDKAGNVADQVNQRTADLESQLQP